MTKHLEALGDTFTINLPTDDKGLFERECPNEECLKLFKVKMGTGLSGEDLKMYCPYCGNHAEPDNFWSKSQISYAESVVDNIVMEAVEKDLKAMEFETHLGLGITMSMKGKTQPKRIQQYIHSELETEVVCNNCTLHYAVYGLFGYCPDCGKHNSLQILQKNLENTMRQVKLAKELDEELSDIFLKSALQTAVASFDGFGRNLYSEHQKRSCKQTKSPSFQNLKRLNDVLEKNDGISISKSLSEADWNCAYTLFQKRHLLAHNAGIIDQKYIEETNDMTAVVGRLITVSVADVEDVCDYIKTIAEYLYSNLLITSNSS